MNLIDYIMDLFRSPDVATAFVRDPEGAMRDAGVPNVSAAQFASVAASAAPAGLAMGGGSDPVSGLQSAVAGYHSIASPFSPQTTIAPQTQTDIGSHNATEFASNNDLASPDQAAGANAQNGAVNLGFGDITLGDKTSNTATDGAVVNTGSAGDIDTTSVKGDGNVVGNEDTNANTGIISGSNVNQGDGNDLDDRNDTTAGGDVIQDNDGPVITDVDMSGGNAGGASGGGGLLGGIGNSNQGGDGGSAGSIVLVDDHSSAVAGNQTTTTVEGDVSGSGGIDNSHDESVDIDDHSESTVLTQIDDHSTSQTLEDNTSVDLGLL